MHNVRFNMNFKENRFSIASCIFSINAFLSALIAIEAFKINDDKSGILWPYLAPLFSVISDKDTSLSFTSLPDYPITDSSIITFLLVAGFVLAISAIIIGFIGRKRGEYSLIYAGPIVFSVSIIFALFPYLKYVLES